ncbi:unnamed protein product [Porites lobata]|uniref:Uncharacterized protein n=1 Tax=Porites lobata TaxID=104759 RepID=A0ABN8MS77_9CNID|nr:unnamed protein product [Porites lobata]
MKILLTVLLFISATAAINNLVGIPDERFQQIEHILKEKRLDNKPYSFDTTDGLGNLFHNVRLFDVKNEDVLRANRETEYADGSGISPPKPGAIEEAVESTVRALLKIVPAVKTLKEARDKRSKEYARQFVRALRNPRKSDNAVEALLGEHIIKLHRGCKQIKLKFAKLANKTGLLDMLGHDDLDFTAIMGKVLEEAEPKEADVFEAFLRKAYEHGIQDHPGVLAIKAVGGLLTEVGCDVKLDGLLGKIGEMIAKHDPDADFVAGFQDKVISFLYDRKNKKCTTGLVESLSPGQSIKERYLNLVFTRCQEVRLVRFAADTVVNAIHLGKKIQFLQGIAHKRYIEMAKTVGALMRSGEFDAAHERVGEFTLGEIRRGFLVGVAVHKLLSAPRPTVPKPSGPRPSRPKPSGPRPSGPQPSGPAPSGPQPSGPAPSGPQPSGPATSGPQPSGPATSGPRPSGPATSGPRPSRPASSGPQPSGSPPSSGSPQKRATSLEEESYLDRLMRLAKRKRIYH